MANPIETEFDPPSLVIWEWNHTNLDTFFQHIFAVQEVTILAEDPDDPEHLKALILGYLAAQVANAAKSDEGGIVGINCKGEESLGQLCSAIRWLSECPWAVAVLDAAGAGAGPIAKIYLVKKDGAFSRLFRGHPPGRLFE